MVVASSEEGHVVPQCLGKSVLRRRARRAAEASAEGALRHFQQRVQALQAEIEKLRVFHVDPEINTRLAAILPILTEEVTAFRNQRVARHEAVARVLRNVALHVFDIPMSDMLTMCMRELNAAQRGSKQAIATDASRRAPVTEFREPKADPWTTWPEVRRAAVRYPPAGPLSVTLSPLRYAFVVVPIVTPTPDKGRRLPLVGQKSWARLGWLADNASSRGAQQVCNPFC